MHQTTRRIGAFSKSGLVGLLVIQLLGCATPARPPIQISGVKGVVVSSEAFAGNKAAIAEAARSGFMQGLVELGYPVFRDTHGSDEVDPQKVSHRIQIAVTGNQQLQTGNSTSSHFSVTLNASVILIATDRITWGDKYSADATEKNRKQNVEKFVTEKAKEFALTFPPFSAVAAR